MDFNVPVRKLVLDSLLLWIHVWLMKNFGYNQQLVRWRDLMTVGVEMNTYLRLLRMSNGPYLSSTKQQTKLVPSWWTQWTHLFTQELVETKHRAKSRVCQINVTMWQRQSMMCLKRVTLPQSGQKNQRMQVWSKVIIIMFWLLELFHQTAAYWHMERTHSLLGDNCSNLNHC